MSSKKKLTTSKDRHLGGIRLCSIPGCANTHFGRGLCAMHRQRVRRNGSINLKRKK